MLTRTLTGRDSQSKSPRRSRAGVVSHDVVRLRREEFATYDYERRNMATKEEQLEASRRGSVRYASRAQA